MFHGLKFLPSQDTKAIMAPEIRSKSFGALEKRAPGFIRFSVCVCVWDEGRGGLNSTSLKTSKECHSLRSECLRWNPNFVFFNFHSFGSHSSLLEKVSQEQREQTTTKQQQ